ncbi:ubiquitin-like small modifier protein 1 [Oceanithermus sp.]|uniref:ubiquitin-like small modifier protein 1 n=1 Tax=Oceanithermus sp. TaxID=2268145 RepID=UPI00257A3333|nr:ubiquitin-like small modifier protein 1 [Oceanithermus sp.]
MRVNLYATFRDVAGVKHLELDGATVGEVLERLLARHPEMQGKLFDAPGVLSERVSVFVNGRDVRYLQGLATPVGPEDVLDLFPPVAGGALGFAGPDRDGVWRAELGGLSPWLLAAYLRRWGAVEERGRWRCDGAWVRFRSLPPRVVGGLRTGRLEVEVGGAEARRWVERISASAMRGGG